MSRFGRYHDVTPSSGIMRVVRRWPAGSAYLRGVACGLLALGLGTGCEPSSQMMKVSMHEQYVKEQEQTNQKLQNQIGELENQLKKISNDYVEADKANSKTLRDERNEAVSRINEQKNKLESDFNAIAGEIKNDIAAKFSQLGELQKNVDRRAEQFNQWKNETSRDMQVLTDKVEKFAGDFSQAVSDLQKDRDRLLVSLKEHYRNLGRQLESGQDGVLKQIMEFETLADDMAKSSGELVKKAQKIIDDIGEQTTEFANELDDQMNQREGESEPTTQPVQP